MAEFTFKLKSDATEYPSRFGGNEVKLTLPDTLDGVREMIQDGVDQDAVLLGLITGQGLRLSKQKKVKDVLGAEKYTGPDGVTHVMKDVGVAEALELARQAAENMRLAAPRAKGKGGRRSARVAEAEAKAESAASALRDTYMKVPASVRKGLRADLLARGMFTEEQLTAMDAEAAK